MINKQIKLIFIIPSLRAGGAERVMSFLSQNMNNKTFNSELVVIEDASKISYPIHTNPVTFLGKKKVRYAIPAIISLLHNRKPDIVLSAISHLNMTMSLLSIFFPKTIFVGRETIVASVKSKMKKGPRINKILYALIPKLLDAIICQSEDMKNDLLKNYGYPEKKLYVINNPVTQKFQLKKSNTSSGQIKQLITVGRLHKQKGYERIISMLSELKIPYHYTIIGDGPHWMDVKAAINEKRISEHITHIPFTNNVESYLASSDLFLKGSYVEGFPNVLLESCAVGTPVVAYNAPGGINEIIIPGLNGEIAENDIDFLNKVEMCLKKKWDSVKIRNSVLEKFSEEKILKDYENLFIELKNSKSLSYHA